jgi:hypothetical protein
MTPNPYESPLTVSTLTTPEPQKIWDEVEIEYDLTIEDYVAFNTHHIRRSPAQRMVRVWSLIIVLVGAELINALLMFAQAFGGPSKPQSISFHMLIAVMLPAVLGIAAIRAYRGSGIGWLTKRMLRSMLTQGDPSLMLGKRRVRVTPQCIEEISELRESKLKLQCIQRIDVTPHYAFVYIAPVMAYILPVRAFVSPDHFATFVANLEGHTGKVAERFKK